MTIYVDADAFPNAIKDILVRAVKRVGVPLVFVANQPMRLPTSDLISLVVVSSGPDVADDRIVEIVTPDDLVVTADIPLADRVIDKGATAINPRGELYTEVNIKQRRSVRDFMDELRSSGVETGGPKSFNPKDRQEFANQLDRFLAKCRVSKKA